MQIRRLLAAICAFFAVIQSALALEPERPGQENFLTRAAYADGRLWILSDAGVLSSLVEGERAWVRATLGDPVLDVCRTLDGKLLALTQKREDNSQWTLHRWQAGTWDVEADIPANNDHLLALDCAGNPMLLATRRFIDIGGKTIEISWTGKRLRGRITSVLRVPGGLLIGANAGEWGGGLFRLDQTTGAIASVERNTSGELCGGPLNYDCDPVNALAALPWKTECAAAAIGLVHRREHGRIVEVCGNRVENLYYSAEPEAIAMSGGDEPFETVAFFALASSADAIWAVGSSELHRIDADGGATVTAMPDFEKIGNIEVSFALPDVILVLTDVNQRKSLSSSTPILVPR